MKSIEHVLSLWKIGMLSSDDVVAWADSQIRASAAPSHDLIELSLAGPEDCLKRPFHEFLARPLALSFSQQFCAIAPAVNLASDQEALAFCKWAAQNAIGDDLEKPLVMFGYRLDHMLDDWDDPVAAIELLRKELPSMLPECAATTAELFGPLPNNSSKPMPLRGTA